MAKKNRLSIDFEHFAGVAERLERLGGDLKATTEKALQESKDYVTANIERDMKSHHRTGKTEASIRSEDKVEWSGNIAEVKVGFDIAHGGLPSIFLMYGTPKMSKDQKLYDDIYGNATKRKLRKIQEEIFAEAVKRAMGG